jgi:nucleoside-diphosphate-sugar epimerase
VQIGVTGGRGLLGGAVVTEACRRGHRVVSIDIKPVVADEAARESQEGAGGRDGARPAVAARQLQADVTSYEELRVALAGCDAVVHLAGHPSPLGAPLHVVHNVNVVASHNALRVAVDTGIEHFCYASSINAMGGAFSRRPRYDYFPIDEEHPTYNEDSYGLSKFIGEIQADSVCRGNGDLSVGSLRIHHLVADRAALADKIGSDVGRYSRDLWGYTTLDAAARACLAVLDAKWKGHEVFFVVAPRTASNVPTAELCEAFYPEVPRRHEPVGDEGLYSCAKARRLLGWEHDIVEVEPG